MTALDIVMLLLTGFGAGLLGGFVGIGGSIIMIPAMLLLLGQNQHLYQAAAMIVNVVVALSGAVCMRPGSPSGKRRSAWPGPGRGLWAKRRPRPGRAKRGC